MEEERRICLTRIRWETVSVELNKTGEERRYTCSHKLSISIRFYLRNVFVGFLSQKVGHEDFEYHLGIIPCFPIRIHYRCSWGGIFP